MVLENNISQAYTILSLSPRHSIFQYPTVDEIFKYVIHGVLENTQWMMNASLYKKEWYYPLAEKSIGKYHEGWFFFLRAIGSLEVNSIFSSGLPSALVIFFNTFFRPKGNTPITSNVLSFVNVPSLTMFLLYLFQCMWIWALLRVIL